MLLLTTLVATGCAEELDGIGGTGGTGGAPVSVDAGVTCIEFCLQTVGNCDAFPEFDEPLCRQGCQINLNEEYGKSEACGMAVESVFQCATELEDCQDVDDWITRVPPDAYPCRDEVETVGQSCPPPP